MVNFDIIIIGAGAAGMMCGAIAGARSGSGSVLLIDSAKSAGEKIRISGGGRCNFTNIFTAPHNFISQNPHFCKSALAGYSPQDFIHMVNQHKIKWHEKEKGQLFCDESANQIIGMLRAACKDAGNRFVFETLIADIKKTDDGFILTTDKQSYMCTSLVIATGGPSIPKMGASGFGYKVAKQFGLKVIDPQPALVPFTFTDGFKETLKDLSGTSLDACVSCKGAHFDGAVLFTHRGLSGPAILQISTYWQAGDAICVDLAPSIDVFARLKEARICTAKQKPSVFLAQFLPKKIAAYLVKDCRYQRLADMNDDALETLAQSVHAWPLKPAGTEGFRKAEVTRGGVDTNALSSKTMQVRTIPGLYFIGEVVDVTGHLGGYNFQWAWASGYACGNAL
ncbi:MAG: NAD(P)/FAD-dependent oxidoreductase [Robiginitomaculum sp.]